MQTNEPETAEQIAALEGVVPELAKLEQLLAEGNQAQIAALKRFAVEPDLRRLRDLIEEQRAEFDALDFLRLSNDEEFHSNFLAWLLDPNQNHGLGDCFLQPFLLQTGEQSQLHTIDWSGTSVHREWVNEVDGQWGYLDILVLNQAEEFLCAIENKIWSWEHSEQLTRYRKALKERYPHWHRHHVFLSPRGTLPYREEEQEYWTAADYNIVLQLVEQAISNSANPVKEDVRAFLQQYATTLRRNIVPDANTNIAELARKIYLDHKEAIEIIINYKPDFIGEAKEEFKKAIGHQQGWTMAYEQDKHIGFHPDNWGNLVEIPDESNLLRFVIDWRWDGGYPRLGLVAPPKTDANEEKRNQLHRACLQYAGIFPGIGNLHSSWLWLLFTDPILDESDYANWQNQAKIRAKIEAWVKNFAENEFPAMNEVIVKCLREYEAETEGQ